MIKNDIKDNIENKFVKAVEQEDINYVTATLNSLRESEEGEIAVLKLVNTEVERFCWKHHGYETEVTCTPLIIAILKNNTEIIDILLKNGANLNRVVVEYPPSSILATNALGFIFYLTTLGSYERIISLDIICRLLPKIIDLNPIVHNLCNDQYFFVNAYYGKICNVLKKENMRFLTNSSRGRFIRYYEEILEHVAVECLLRGSEENISIVKDLYRNSIIGVQSITDILDSYLKVRKFSSSELQNLIKYSKESFCGYGEEYFSVWETIAEKYVDNNIQILPANYPQALKSYMTKADKVKNVSRTLEYLVGHLQGYLGFGAYSYEPDASVMQMKEGRELAKKREEIVQEFEKKIFKYIGVVTEKALNKQIVECRRQKQSSMFLMKLEERYYFVGEDINRTRLEGYIDEIPLIGLCSELVLEKDSTILFKLDEIKKIIIEDLFGPEKALVDMLSDQNFQDTSLALQVSECDKDLILTLCELVTVHSDRLEQCKNSGVKNKIIKLIKDYEDSDSQAIEFAKALVQLKKKMDELQGRNQKEIKTLRSEIQNLQQEIKSLKKSLNERERLPEVNALRQQLQGEREARQALEGQLQEGKREVQALKLKVVQLGDAVALGLGASFANKGFFGKPQEQRSRKRPRNDKVEDERCTPRKLSKKND